MISIFIKTTKGVLCDVTVNELSSVFQLKEEIVSEAKLEVKSANQLHLIFRGLHLEDERTLKSYGIQDGCNVYMLFEKAKLAEPPKPKEKPAPPMNNMFAMYQTPIGKAIMKIVEENPQIYVNMITNNPAFKSLAEQNPQFSHLLNDPDLLSDQIKMLQNPESMALAARSIDRMLDNVEVMPGGFQAVSKSISSIQDPLLDGLSEQFRLPQKSTTIPEVPLSEPSSEPLPLITTPQPSFPPFMGNEFNDMNFNSGFGDFGLQMPNLPPPMSPFGNQAMNPVLPPPLPSTGDKLIMDGIQTCEETGFDILSIPGMAPLFKAFSSVPKTDLHFSNEQLKNRYRDELKELYEMGFSDLEGNIQALVHTDGNIDTAIDYIIERQTF